MQIQDVLDQLGASEFAELVLEYFSDEQLQRLADYAARVYDLDAETDDSGMPYYR